MELDHGQHIAISYSNSVYRIKFVTKQSLKVYPGIGRCFPVTTQCIVTKNSFIIGLGTVTKHERDKDDLRYARTYSAKKALNNDTLKYWDELRGIMWSKINDIK
jgi:hypothetical protein